PSRRFPPRPPLPPGNPRPFRHLPDQTFLHGVASGLWVPPPAATIHTALVGVERQLEHRTIPFPSRRGRFQLNTLQVQPKRRERHVILLFTAHNVGPQHPTRIVLVEHRPHLNDRVRLPSKHRAPSHRPLAPVGVVRNHHSDPHRPQLSQRLQIQVHVLLLVLVPPAAPRPHRTEADHL